jgi:hypothetical protein
MTEYQLLILTYVIFIWLVLLHTFEEIAHGVFDINVGIIHITRSKYLLAASLLTTINLVTFILIYFQFYSGYIFGLFTSGINGVFQALAHSVGYIKERKPTGLGVGFYSSIPLAICGLILLIQIVNQ